MKLVLISNKGIKIRGKFFYGSFMDKMLGRTVNAATRDVNKEVIYVYSRDGGIFLGTAEKVNNKKETLTELES